MIRDLLFRRFDLRASVVVSSIPRRSTPRRVKMISIRSPPPSLAVTGIPTDYRRNRWGRGGGESEGGCAATVHHHGRRKRDAFPFPTLSGGRRLVSTLRCLPPFPFLTRYSFALPPPFSRARRNPTGKSICARDSNEIEIRMARDEGRGGEGGRARWGTDRRKKR